MAVRSLERSEEKRREKEEEEEEQESGLFISAPSEERKCLFICVCGPMKKGI